MAKPGPREFPWFRCYVETTRDLKIRLEPVTTRWAWVAVLALARRSPQPGRLLLSDGVRVTVAHVADEANITVKQAGAALTTFQTKEMVDVDASGVYIVIHWATRQPETRGKSDPNSPPIPAELPPNSPRSPRNSGPSLSREEETEVPSEPSERDTEGEADSQHPTDPEHPQAGQTTAIVPAGRGERDPALSDRSLLAEFDEWWRVWPKRDAKHTALEAYKKRRRAGRPAEALLAAAGHVAESIENGHADLQFTPLPATFLNQHRDEDWENGPPVPPQPPRRPASNGSNGLRQSLANLASITPGMH